MPSNAPAPVTHVFLLHRWLDLVKIRIFNHNALLLYFMKCTVTFVISSEVLPSTELPKLYFVVMKWMGKKK